MKLGDYEKFNDMCGIAYVYNEITKKNWYVVFADTYKHPNITGEGGTAIAKGKTKEEALKNAIIFFMKRERGFEDVLEEEDCDKINIKNILRKAIDYLDHHQFTNSFRNEVILPIHTEWGKTENAGICFVDGKAHEWIS